MLQMCFGCSHTTKICKRKNVLLTYFLHSNEDMKTNRKKNNNTTNVITPRYSVISVKCMRLYYS